jgi:metal-responsive CopG/Arc/MetJ family transcriptional regulator
MTTKIAVSLPSETYRKLETARRKHGISRSAAVKRAIDAWLASAERERRIREYVEGYERTPENPREISAWENNEAWGEWK